MTTFEAYLGQRGTGKSILLHHRILESERCLFFDPIGDWPGRTFESIDALVEEAEEREFFRFAFTPRDPKVDADAFAEACRYLGNLTAAFDEADLFAPPHQVSDEVKSFLLRSRHDEISVLFATQRPAAIDRMMLSQANAILACRLVDPRDLDAVRPYFGKHTELLPRLRKGQHVKVSF